MIFVAVILLAAAGITTYFVISNKH